MTQLPINEFGLIFIKGTHMIKFKKIKETKEIFDASYFFLVRDLKSNQDLSKNSDSDIIDDIIKSKYHNWRGEDEPEGLTFSISKFGINKPLNNFKFYGFFDNGKISSLNYKRVVFEEFKKKMFAVIHECDNDENAYEIRAQKIINAVINPTAIFYHLDLNEEINTDMVAEWTTYSVFIAFISLDKQNNIATLIEFGQD